MRTIGSARAVDFGYSKTADETLAKWGRGELIDGEQIGLESCLTRGVFELQGPNPCHAAGSPVVLGLTIDELPAKAILAEPVLGPEQVELHGSTIAANIGESLIRFARRVNLGEELSSEELGQPPGIAAIGLVGLKSTRGAPSHRG